MSNLFFCVWMIPVLLHIADCGKFELTAPSNEIIAEAGGTTDLPCYIKSRISAVNMIVDWFRNGSLVHRYTKERDDNENQDPTFRMRTSLFKDELVTGKVSLKLLVVKGTDEGNYTCSVTSPTMNWKDDLNIKVIVKAVGSQPVVSIEGRREAGVGLVCKTQGWHPEPQMVWLDNDGFPIPAGPPETTRDTEGLYTLRLRATVQKTGSNRFTCTVKHKYMERDMIETINVPDELFYQDHTWKWVPLVFGVFLSAAAVAAFIYFRVKRQKEQRRFSAMLSQEKARHSQENENLRQEKARLSQENDEIHAEKERFSREKDEIHAEKDEIHAEKDWLSRKTDFLDWKNDEIHAEKDWLSRKTDFLDWKNENLRQENERLSREKEIFSKQLDLVNTRGYQDYGVVRRHVVDVSLDPDTAHPNLILSADGKQVSYGDQQDRPDIPKRFDECPYVLGRESFSSGQFYYEVQVNNKTEWLLGVAKQYCRRKGSFNISPSNGYWTISLRKDGKYQALEETPVHLHLSQKPQKVGVFVDYEDGTVSFYNVEAKIHIFSFTKCCFKEELYPIFSPNPTGDSGENSAPLVICPVDSDKPESLHLSESQTHESDSAHQLLLNQDHQSESCEEINESVSFLENSASSKV